MKRNYTQPAFTVEEIMEELGNLDINDLENLLGSESKSYRKKSI